MARQEPSAKVVKAAIIALPGVLLLLNRTFKFEQRADWYWRKCSIAKRFSRQLRDDSAAVVATVSSKYGEASEKHELKWPGLSSPGGEP